MKFRIREGRATYRNNQIFYLPGNMCVCIPDDTVLDSQTNGMFPTLRLFEPWWDDSHIMRCSSLWAILSTTVERALPSPTLCTQALWGERDSLSLNRLLKGEKFFRYINVEGLLGHNKMCKNRMPRNCKGFSGSIVLGIPKAEPKGDGLSSWGYRSRVFRIC